MKAKPKGAKYRGLVRRGGVIYYRRTVDGKRVCFSLDTDDWDAAAQARALYEEKKGSVRSFFSAEVPTFAEIAARYLREDVGHLAPTTRGDRTYYLGEGASLVSFFGPRRLDEITPPLLRRWWAECIDAKGRSTATGRHHLDILAGVFGFALDLGLIESSPVPGFREQLRRRMRTQKGRAEAEAGRHVHAIEDPEEIARLIVEAQREGAIPAAFVLTLLDAGLRVGEALALTWGAVAWGESEHDPRRALMIDRARPRGGEEGFTKSGRARRVALSRRLRAVLLDLYEARFRPSPEALIFNGLDPKNFYHRGWRRILERAGIGRRALKDLRDTFASQLLTSGVSLAYVSKQLGHADVAVTATYRPTSLLDSTASGYKVATLRPLGLTGNARLCLKALWFRELRW